MVVSVECEDHFPYISTPSVETNLFMQFAVEIDEFDHVKIKYVLFAIVFVHVAFFFFFFVSWHFRSHAAFLISQSDHRQITNQMRTVARHDDVQINQNISSLF